MRSKSAFDFACYWLASKIRAADNLGVIYRALCAKIGGLFATTARNFACPRPAKLVATGGRFSSPGDLLPRAKAGEMHIRPYAIPNMAHTLLRADSYSLRKK